MIRSRYIEPLCVGAALGAVLLTLFFPLVAQLGQEGADAPPGYIDRLFDTRRVHQIDLQVENWAEFIAAAPLEHYISCSVSIDGERFLQVGLRAKGNNSLRLTEDYGLSRFGLKLEFDHYLDGGNYHGLDKFSLDASFQDNSYLKSYLVYDMMAYMQVPAPLCSFAWVTVNGVPWGLFLAIEEPEEAFAKRNFGAQYGQLYKPDYRSLGAENADVALRYVDAAPESYPNIFENAKFPLTRADKARLIRALRQLSTGENLEEAVDVSRVLRYFTVQVFVLNWDSYIGYTGHNYYLYEEQGRLSMLPWDYNLAFGSYALGMSEPIRDPNILINYPINTPQKGEIMKNRPLYHNIMQNPAYFRQYQAYFDQLLTQYLESGRAEACLRQAEALIAPYVAQDPTAFCSFADHQLAVDTLWSFCALRAKSVRGQLQGTLPASLAQQGEHPEDRVDASQLILQNLGDFQDLEQAKPRQDAALRAVVEAGG